MGGKFTFWEARAMPRSVTHLPRSANPHLCNPSALSLAMPCWLRKYKPRAAFWSLSAALFCQAEAFLSSDTKCSPSFPPPCPRELRTLPPAAAPAFGSPREQGSRQDTERPARRETHARGLGRGGGGEFGGTRLEKRATRLMPPAATQG